MRAGYKALQAGFNNKSWRGGVMAWPAQLNGAAARSSGAATSAGNNEDWDRVKDILSSLIKNKTRADGKNWRDAHENMPVYLQRLGMEKDVQQLNVIHVAGTKGKGSTCAMVERILRSAGYTTGLFTSPHLCDVRERIRINGQMVSKDVFAGAFWHCYNTLQQSATDEVGMPGYFRFLTLLGLQVFTQARPDVVILEVGIGGRIDATNILKAPIVTGITSLGFDHMELLGHTLDLIATEKAGIMRHQVPCFTVEQPPEAMAALQSCAAAVGAPLVIAPSLDSFTPAASSSNSSSSSSSSSIPVGLAGEHQRLNASLAVALAQSWEQRNLQRQQQQQQQETGTQGTGADVGSGVAGATSRLQQLGQGLLPAAYCEGLAQARWPGRSQVVPHQRFCRQPTSSSSSSDSSAHESSSSRLTYFLDGAHTPESMLTCAAWFAHVTQQQPQQQQQQQEHTVRVLIFNCMKERDPSVLLPQLHSGLQQQGATPDLALFVPPDSQYAFLPSSKTQALVAAAHLDLSWQQQLQQVWQQCQGSQSQQGSKAAVMAQLPALPSVPGVGLPVVSSGSAVLSSVGQAMAWLEQAAAERPQLQLQVLVTGSLYLVGDCLLGLQQQQQQQQQEEEGV